MVQPAITTKYASHVAYEDHAVCCKGKLITSLLSLSLHMKSSNLLPLSAVHDMEWPTQSTSSSR